MRPIIYENDTLYLLDQRLLPLDTKLVPCRTVAEVCTMIETLAVRGAPAIGIAASYALVLAARSFDGKGDFAAYMAEAEAALAATRPTAVNLFWSLKRMRAVWQSVPPVEAEQALLAEARAIEADDADRCRRMGAHGAALLPPDCRVLTHCNAGALATGGCGTALAVVRAAHATGKLQMVYADETRPLLQGARLTAWELQEDHIPVTLICDNMAASLMAQGKIDAVVVGADRIATNGDTANKIGTYGVAVLAHYHHIPFYVAAPLSTFDPDCACGADIVIEQRDPAEVRGFGGCRTAPTAVPVCNPAFDVTPVELITAHITEDGVRLSEKADSGQAHHPTTARVGEEARPIK